MLQFLVGILDMIVANDRTEHMLPSVRKEYKLIVFLQINIIHTDSQVMNQWYCLSQWQIL